MQLQLVPARTSFSSPPPSHSFSSVCLSLFPFYSSLANQLPFLCPLFRCCCCSSCIPHFDVFQIKTRRPPPLYPFTPAPFRPPCSLLVSSLITICWHSECQSSSSSRSAELLPLTAPVPGSSADSATPPSPPPSYSWQAKRGCGSARNIQFSCFAQHAIHAFADDIQERQTQRVRE